MKVRRFRFPPFWISYPRLSILISRSGDSACRTASRWIVLSRFFRFSLQTVSAGSRYIPLWRFREPHNPGTGTLAADLSDASPSVTPFSTDFLATRSSATPWAPTAPHLAPRSSPNRPAGRSGPEIDARRRSRPRSPPIGCTPTAGAERRQPVKVGRTGKRFKCRHVPSLD